MDADVRRGKRKGQKEAQQPEPGKMTGGEKSVY